MTAPQVYEEFSQNGCIIVPAGAIAVSIPMWTDDSGWELCFLKTGDSDRLKGDLDLDGDVDAYDLTKHARYVGGIITDWEQD